MGQTGFEAERPTEAQTDWVLRTLVRCWKEGRSLTETLLSLHSGQKLSALLYLSGLPSLWAAVSIHAEGRWINSQIAMPESYVEVLVRTSCGRTRVSVWTGERWQTYPGSVPYTRTQVPFWQPLPEPPGKKGLEDEQEAAS